MEQFQLASAIFLKEFLRIVDFQNINIESIDEHIEQLKSQMLQNKQQQQQIGNLKEEQENGQKQQILELEQCFKQKIKKKQKSKQRNKDQKNFYCQKCNKRFNHTSSLSRHKKNQHKNIKQDMIQVKQLQSQQQGEVIINLTDLEI